MREKKWTHHWLEMRRVKKIRHQLNQKDYKTIFKWVMKGGGIVFLLAFFWLFFIFIPSLPDVLNIENLTAAQASEIRDREGNLLYRIHGDENRESVELEDIAPHAVEAVLAIEDDQFYRHMGIDIGGILKAVCAEVGFCPARGGSTITQQFIKNAFLGPERTYSRKLKEIFLALKLERNFTKDEILEMYLNRIPYGSNIYGIERAANVFFGKSAKDLTLEEGAVLAAIPKAPTFYSPYGNNKYASITIDAEKIFEMDLKTEQDLVGADRRFIQKGLLGKTHIFTEGGERVMNEGGEEGASEAEVDEGGSVVSQREIYVKGRVDFVLERMEFLGYITSQQRDAALQQAESLAFSEFREEIKAPHFVMYVRQYLEDKYGKDQVEKGGLNVITTIDPAMQEAAEKAVTAYAEQNLKRYNASNASLVATDPNNGQILAMVGSVDYWNDEIDGKVNVALRPRLPGSSFKPIVYAAAFLQGYAPSTVLYDVKTKFGAWYEPENYDGQYRGPVTLKKALAHSLNVPAVKAAYLAGIPNVIDLARKMGVQLNQPDDWYGLSLALGAGEARLIDMVQAYGIFANGGYAMDPVSILKIEDRNGNILEEYQSPQNKRMILDPQVAYLINYTLSDVDARPEGWWRQQLSIPGQVNGAKTGTSNKKKGEINYPFDTWTLGYTRRLAAGVWAGNNDGQHLGLKASGLDTAGRIWHDFMVAATEGKPSEPFDKPEGIKWVNISQKTGQLPSEHTPPDQIINSPFASFSVPTEYDQSYRLVKIDKVSGKLATEFTPEAAIEERAYFQHHAILPDNVNWEKAVRDWARANHQDETPPTEYDDVHTAETMGGEPSIVIISPQALSEVAPPSLGVWVDIESKSGVSHVEYYWDDELVHIVDQPPYKGVIKVSKRGTKAGEIHELKAVIYDRLLRSNQSSITVKIGEDKTSPVIDFVYPDKSTELPANTSVPVQIIAFDENGDVKEVEFYIEGELMTTLKAPPYVWQWTTPDQPGDYRLKVVAYDHAKNKSEKSLLISTHSTTSPSVSQSQITSPHEDSVHDEGDRLLVKAVLSPDEKVKEVVLQAHQKGQLPLEIAKWLNRGNETVLNHTFVWDPLPAGTYSLSLKIVLSDGRIHFSQRVPIVIR